MGMYTGLSKKEERMNKLEKRINKIEHIIKNDSLSKDSSTYSAKISEYFKYEN